MVLALAAILGILAAEAGWARDTAYWLAGTAATLLLAALVSGRSWLLLPAVTLTFAFIHQTRLEQTFQHPLRSRLKVVDKPPEAIIHGTLLPEYSSSVAERQQALCTTQRVEIPSLGVVLERPATLLVLLPRGAHFPGAGTYELRGRIYLPRGATNPGAFDAEQNALRNGRVARLNVEKLYRTGPSGQELWSLFLERAEDCRRWIGAQLTRDLEQDPETAAVIRAMALGASSEADDEIEDAFRNSGTLHVFAVSGLHVALLGVIATTLLRQLLMPRALALGLMITLVFAYAFITGWQPSAARAAFMVAMCAGAGLVDRESSLANSLGAAALLLLAVNTHPLFMPGFQLSFGVLWASAVGSAPLIAWLGPWTKLDPFLPPQLASGWQRFLSACRRWFATTLSVSFAAWVGSLPFILAHFQSITPVAVVANCLLVPLSFFCLGATSLSLCAALFHASGLQLLFNNLNWLFAKLMIASAAWFANLPGAHFHYQPHAPDTAAPVVWRTLALPGGSAANHLRIGDVHWLLDTGDAASFRKILRPCLHSSGVNRLQGVLLSHNDAAHIGALPQVLETFTPPALYASTQEPGPQDSRLTVLRQLLATSPPAHLSPLAVDEHLPLGTAGALKVEAVVLHPTRQVLTARGDDRAMVLMLHLGPWRVLWVSDAGWNTEKSLCESQADLRCHVLVRSQHEHDLMPSREFLQRTSPRVILAGSDPRDSATELPTALAEYAAQHGISLFDTWADGSIELFFQPQSLELHATHSGRRLQLP